jgi:2-polyprenyl-3-methyl-5-hydroxy-6-metoxy-1,4-benzoquinol methylase
LSRAAGDKGKVLAAEIDRNFFPHIERKAKAAGVTNVQTIAGEPTDPTLPEPVDVALLHDVLHHIENPAAYIKSLAKYLKPTARVVIVDYLSKQGPHRDDPLLQVGKEEAAKLLAATASSRRTTSRSFRTSTSSSTADSGALGQPAPKVRLQTLLEEVVGYVSGAG